MVFVLRLMSRMTHISCAMLMLLLSAAPLLSKPDKDGFFSVHISDNTSVPVNSKKLGIALFVLSVLSGLFNAHSFKVSETIPDRQTRLRWRMHVYFLKSMMVLALTPLLEMSLEMYFDKVGASISPADKRQTAAVTRCYVTLMLAAIGSYCKLVREDSAKNAPATSPSKKVDAATTAPQQAKKVA